MKRNIYITILLCLLCGVLSSQNWVVDYHGDYPSGRTHFSSGFVDEDGVTFLSGYQGSDGSNSETLLMRIEPDGTHTETVYHKEGCRSMAHCIVETDDHKLFVTGIFNDNLDNYLMTLIYDKELNLLHEARYEKEMDAIMFGESNATVDSHGNIIVSTALANHNQYGAWDYHGVFYKFDSQGELLSHKFLLAEAPDPVFYLRRFQVRQMWYREEDEQLLCLAPGFGNVMSFITFDSAFNYISEYPILRGHDSDTVSDDFHTLISDCYTDHWYTPEEALFFSSKGDENRNKLRISRVNIQGEYLDFIRLHERADTIDDVAHHRCMATANDSTFYFSFYQHVYSRYPGEAAVYMLNDRLEIIGRYVDDQHDSFRSMLIMPTPDGGCITVNDSTGIELNSPCVHPKITKLRKEDFETIGLDVISEETAFPTPFPNPTTGMLYLPLSDMTLSKGRFRVYDQQGRVVSDRILDGCQGMLQVNLSSLKAGIYFYEIRDKDTILLRERIVKE